MSYDAWQCRQFLTNQIPKSYLTQIDTQTDTQRIDILSGPALRAAPAPIFLIWNFVDPDKFAEHFRTPFIE